MDQKTDVRDPDEKVVEIEIQEYTHRLQNLFSKNEQIGLLNKIILGVQHNISHVVDKEDSVRYT